MKTLLVAIIGAIVAVGAISAVSTVGFTDDGLSITSINPVKSSAAVMGHVTLTAYDEDGNIKAYRQTDNVVTNVGDDCIAAVIFAGASAHGCTTPALGKFDNIAIGTGDSSSATETTKTLVNPNVPGTISPTGWTTAVVTPATGQGGASTLLTATFYDVNAVITEAAIQDGTTTVGTESVLAVQSFDSITLGATDDLTIQWTVVIDGS
jgi:L-ribulose-5-phosphate 3-epimerase UlaE